MWIGDVFTAWKELKPGLKLVWLRDVQSFLFLFISSSVCERERWKVVGCGYGFIYSFHIKELILWVRLMYFVYHWQYLFIVCSSMFLYAPVCSRDSLFFRWLVRPVMSTFSSLYRGRSTAIKHITLNQGVCIFARVESLPDPIKEHKVVLLPRDSSPC